MPIMGPPSPPPSLKVLFVYLTRNLTNLALCTSLYIDPVEGMGAERCRLLGVFQLWRVTKTMTQSLSVSGSRGMLLMVLYVAAERAEEILQH